MAKTHITSEAGGNVLSVGMPENAEQLNRELLEISDMLENDSGLLPENKAEAAAADAAAEAKQKQIEVAAGMVRKGLSMLSGMAIGKYPALVNVWTEKAIDRIALAAAAVLLKHGIESGEFMQKYAEEIELLMAAGEPMMVSYFIIKAAKEEAARIAGGMPTGQDNNTVDPSAGGASNVVATLA